LHKYLYTHADPINGIDPSGLFGVAGAMAGASIAAHIASVKMGVDFNVLLSVKATVDRIRAGLTPSQIFGRYINDLAIGAVMVYGVMFAPGIITSVIQNTSHGLDNFIKSGYKGLWNMVPNINNPLYGRVLGQGGRKIVYELSNEQNLVVAVPRRMAYVDEIKKELDMLGKLDCMGFPVPRVVGTTEVNGIPSYVMQKYAQGSKDIVRTIGNNPQIVGSSSYLNQQSIQDLKAIKQMMVDKNIRIHDLQFLIGHDGRIVIADPVDVIIGKAPSPDNLTTINRLIEAAGGKP
jgi:hypothetical protein